MISNPIPDFLAELLGQGPAEVYPRRLLARVRPLPPLPSGTGRDVLTEMAVSHYSSSTPLASGRHTDRIWTSSFAIGPPVWIRTCHWDGCLSGFFFGSTCPGSIRDLACRSCPGEPDCSLVLGRSCSIGADDELSVTVGWGCPSSSSIPISTAGGRVRVYQCKGVDICIRLSSSTRSEARRNRQFWLAFAPPDLLKFDLARPHQKRHDGIALSLVSQTT